MEVAAQEAIDGALGHDLSEPMVARVLFRQAAAARCGHHGVGLHAHPRSGVVRPGPPDSTGRCGPTGVPMGSTAWSRRRSGSPPPGGAPFALLGDLGFPARRVRPGQPPDLPCTLRRHGQRGRGDLLVPPSGGRRGTRAVRVALRHAPDIRCRRRGAGFRSLGLRSGNRARARGRPQRCRPRR